MDFLDFSQGFFVNYKNIIVYVRKSGELNFYYLYDVDLNLVGVDLLVIL